MWVHRVIDSQSNIERAFNTKKNRGAPGHSGVTTAPKSSGVGCGVVGKWAKWNPMGVAVPWVAAEATAQMVAVAHRLRAGTGVV